jgi:TonB family protein
MRRLAVTLALSFALAAQAGPDPQALTQQAKDLLSNDSGRQQAEALLVQALPLFEKQAPKSDSYAEALTLLALVRHFERTSNKDALASDVEPLARKALEIRQKNPDTPSADVALDCELEAMVLEEMGRLEDSRAPKAQARALRDQIIIAMQPMSDAAEKVSFMSDPELLPPRLIARSDPEYSFAARVLKLQSDILAELVIEANGAVRRIEIFRPTGFGLDEQAVAALLKWKFIPAQKNGQPVPVEGNVKLRFRLPGMPPPKIPDER